MLPHVVAALVVRALVGVRGVAVLPVDGVSVGAGAGRRGLVVAGRRLLRGSLAHARSFREVRALNGVSS